MTPDFKHVRERSFKALSSYAGQTCSSCPAVTAHELEEKTDGELTRLLKVGLSSFCPAG